MPHPIHRVVDFELVGPYTLRVIFDDETEQIIDFRPVLEGALYGPLKDSRLFEQVTIDPEAGTLVWPNGADFDPAILHDWPRHRDELERMAKRWAEGRAKKVA